MTDDQHPTLFQRLGGHDGISVAITNLYERILDDDDLAPFFDLVDIENVKRHQRELVTTAVGGPSMYTGRSIREAHDGYAIEPRHLDLLSEHLRESLALAGVAPTDAATVIGLIHRMWHAQFWPA